MSFAQLKFVVDHAEEVEKEGNNEKGDYGEGRVGSHDAHFATVFILICICQHSQNAHGEDGINNWSEVALVRPN